MRAIALVLFTACTVVETRPAPQSPPQQPAPATGSQLGPLEIPDGTRYLHFSTRDKAPYLAADVTMSGGSPLRSTSTTVHVQIPGCVEVPEGADTFTAVSDASALAVGFDGVNTCD